MRNNDWSASHMKSGSSMSSHTRRQSQSTALLPYVEWVIGFLQWLKDSQEDEAILGREAIREAVKDGALPSVFLQAVHSLLEIGVDLRKPPAERHYPGAYEHRIKSIQTMLAELKEVIRLRKEIAARSAKLNPDLLNGRLPAKVLRHLLGNAGAWEPMSTRNIKFIRIQSSNDLAFANLLSNHELILWEKLVSKRQTLLTRKFLLFFLYRYFTLRTGAAHAQQIVDLVHAGIGMAFGSRSGEPPIIKRLKAGTQPARRRASVTLENLYSVASRFPSEHRHAAEAIEGWARREANKGPWQSHDKSTTYESEPESAFFEQFDALILALAISSE